jgi:hypothetical protein
MFAHSRAKLGGLYVYFNAKKGQNAYALCFLLIFMGGVIQALWMLAWGWEVLFQPNLGDGKVLMALGGFFLPFTIAGSFFNFGNDRMILRLAGTMVGIVTILGILLALGLFGPIRIMAMPWNVVFLTLLALVLSIMGAMTFVHASKKEEESRPAQAMIIRSTHARDRRIARMN